MTANVELVDPKRIKANPDNPRLIFREDELSELEQSISSQGILVPLSIYPERTGYVLLDGERRWRCAIRLGLHRVPTIVQPKPNKITNIMMMFAIHHARKDWDPLPTAMKLEQLEEALTKAKGTPPKEGELAAAASLTKGEVRRLKKILRIPEVLKAELLEELKKPRTEQKISLDQVLEATVAADRMQRAGLIHKNREIRAAKVIVEKFRTAVLKNTTDPRKISKIITYLDDGHLSKELVVDQISLFLNTPNMTIDSLYQNTAQAEELFKSAEKIAERLLNELENIPRSIGALPDNLRGILTKLLRTIGDIVK